MWKVDGNGDIQNFCLQTLDVLTSFLNVPVSFPSAAEPGEVGVLAEGFRVLGFGESMRVGPRGVPPS